MFNWFSGRSRAAPVQGTARGGQADIHGAQHHPQQQYPPSQERQRQQWEPGQQGYPPSQGQQWGHGQQWQQGQQHHYQDLDQQPHGRHQQSQIQSQQSPWQLRADSFSQKLDRLSEEVKAARKEFEDLRECAQKENKAQRSSHERQIKKKDRTIQELQSALNEKERKQKTKDDTIQRLSTQLSDEKTNVAELQIDNTDLKSRLSQMASKMMRENNPCVEDLNDPNRPSAIKDKWEALFTSGEYWTAFSNMKNSKLSEEDIPGIIYTACKETYETCAKYVNDKIRHEVNVLTGAADDIQPEGQPRSEQEQEGHPKELKDAMANLRKQILHFHFSEKCPEDLSKECMQRVGEDKKQWMSKFISKLSEVCYLMHRQEIPLAVDFSTGPESLFDKKLFQLEERNQKLPPDAVIKHVFRPPLLRQKNGAVLCKGEASVEEKARPSAPPCGAAPPHQGASDMRPPSSAPTEKIASVDDETSEMAANNSISSFDQSCKDPAEATASAMTQAPAPPPRSVSAENQEERQGGAGEEREREAGEEREGGAGEERERGAGGERQQGAGGERQGGAGGERQGGAGGERQEGAGGERQGETGGEKQEGAGGERQEGAGGERQGGAGGEKQEGAGGERQGGAGGERQEGAGGEKQEGAGGERQGRAGREKQGGAGGE